MRRLRLKKEASEKINRYGTNVCEFIKEVEGQVYFLVGGVQHIISRKQFDQIWEPMINE